MVRRYLDYAVFWDLIFCAILAAVIFIFKSYIKAHFHFPTIISQVGTSLISVSSSLIGFLLTIITVIVTFKKGFEEYKKNKPVDEQNDASALEGPEQTIFDKIISKEAQFYGSSLHKKVAGVLIGAALEVGLVLSTLLGLQFELIKFTQVCTVLITFFAFVLIVLSLIRSFYIFKLFINVHLHK